MARKGFGRRDERVSLVLAAAVGAMAFGAEAPAAAHARMQASQLAAEVRSYAIPAGTVGMALNRLAEENGVQMVFLAGLTRNVRTGGLKGDYSLGAALDELLAGTGLGYRLADDEREVFIVLAQNGAVRSDASGAEALPPIDVGAEQGPARRGAAGAGRHDSSEDSGPGYSVVDSRAATKTKLPILDTPRSVQVIPRRVLEDNQVLNVQEAVKFVSGVQTGSLVFYDQFQIRGFATSGNTFRNGLKLFTTSGTEDVAFVDRVEIVKGPTAMLYGRIQPGGLVNFVTKKPQAESAYSVQEQFGSWGLSRTTVDATGPLDDQKSLLYRVIGVFDHADDFVDFRHRDNGAASATLAWSPTTQFESNIQLEYYNNNTTNKGFNGQQVPALAKFYPVPGVVGRPADLPRHWTQNDPGMYGNFPDKVERILVAANWTYRFDESWKITNRFHYNHTNENLEYFYQNSFDLSTWNMVRQLSFEHRYRDTYALNLDVNGEFMTGPLKHGLLLGFDYYDFHTVSRGDDRYNGNTPGAVPMFNVFAPVYGGIAWPILRAEHALAAGNILYRQKQQDVGYYIQDDVSFDDKVHLLLGGRYDIAFDANSEIYGVFEESCFPGCDGHYNPPGKGNPTERKFSPNAGLLLKPTADISLYASYSESFANSNSSARSFDNHVFKPEQARQYEMGAKARLFDGSITASVAAFDLRRTNVLSGDPAHPNFSIASGEVRSRGVEFDIAGQATENISLIGSYTYDDAVIVKDTTIGLGAQLGNRFPGVPLHSGNFWAKYDTAPGLSEGWTFGAGFYAVGLRQGNATNSWALPGYVRFDAMLGYRTVVLSVPVEAQLNVVNLGDEKYFEAGAASFAYYGAPRTFVGSIKVKF
jgi:iron complex outermembrane receptor protein